MTTPIKTQCPHCHTIFNIKKTQLNQKAATACCEHCQKTFLVNSNLIVTADTDNNSKHTDTEYSKNQYNEPDQKIDITTTNKNPSPQSTIKEDDGDMLIHDDMIHDDMDISDDDSPEYDSLDSMDAWLAQAADSDTLDDTSLKKAIKASESSNNLLKATSTPNLSSNNAPSSSAQVALSSAAANHIHASIDNTTDESWLEKLLKEQNQDEDVPNQNSNTDLSQLLVNMGVDLKEDNNNQEARARLQEATEFSPTPSRRSVATLLWLCGCLVLAMLLFAQYIIFNLNHLVKNPSHAERLQTICSIVACSLPSADLKALGMSDISYQSSRVNPTSGFSDISAAINNQSSQAQLYPHVKVSIYGADLLIGEFIAAPDQYLVGKQSQLAPNSRKQLLFTVPVSESQITKIAITPIY